MIGNTNGIQSDDWIVFDYQTIRADIGTSTSWSGSLTVNIDSSKYDIYCVRVGLLSTTNTGYATMTFGCTISGSTATVSVVRTQTGNVTPNLQCLFIGVHK